MKQLSIECKKMFNIDSDSYPYLLVRVHIKEQVVFMSHVSYDIVELFYDFLLFLIEVFIIFKHE